MATIQKKSLRRDRLAHFIKAGRKKKEWMQSDLAEKLGVSVSLISAWETQRQSPSLENFVRLWNMLDFTALEADYWRED